MTQKNYYSQIGQDLFVERVLQEKQNGLFFDIGGGFPTHINNTYMLETYYKWTGISIDLESTYEQQWKDSGRSSTFLIQDALTADYKALMGSLIEKDQEKRINYLSVDLEPPINTFLALQKIPFDSFRFSVITFEHDMYRKDPGHNFDSLYILRESRKIFSDNGYGLVFANMQEDWWVDKSFFEETSYIDINEIPKDILYY
jgi:hypothetical protein